tara:strand:+ start:230 stop:637 length:408 start_codon:yes stop_codon:yes gene_type:complete
MNIKLSFLICFLVASDFIYAKNTIDDVEIGQIWSLETRSNKLSVGNSKVLYFFSNDAYNTYQARRFSDWDQFSVIDAKNLVRLNTGDKIEILKSKHHEKIFEVKLLDGFEKNRIYFTIKEDLLNDFKLMGQKNEQ